MKQALILHGTAATPESNWFTWLKGELEIAGYKVWLPQLPAAETPNTITYNRFLLNTPDFTIDPDTVIIGHSSGAVEALNLLQHLPQNVKAGDVYAVSAFRDNLNLESLNGLFTEAYEYGRIELNARSITFIHSDNDPYVPLEHAEFLSAQLDAPLILIPGQGHFNTEQSETYVQFPELLQLITAAQ